MGVMERLETKDSGITSQFSRFVVVGGISTLINYGIFFVLYTILSVNYIAASAAGYVIGAVFGYLFNARLTFKSSAGFSIIPYFVVYLFSLVASLGVLKFFSVSLAVSPLIANVIAIAFSTATNFSGCRWAVFNRSFKLPQFFRSKIFLTVLAIKIVVSFLLASDFMTNLFVPFVDYFISNPLSNPYQHFFDIGSVKSFPYPLLMLFLVSIPGILLGAFGGSAFFGIFSIRLSLLAADIVIFAILYRLLQGKEKHTLFLYWASPVVFYITYVHGQLDMIPVALLFASAYFLKNRSYVKSSILLAAALATKSFVLVALPIYFIYLAQKKLPYRNIAILLIIVGIVYSVFVLPYATEGFMHMVFEAEEQFRLFSLSVDFKSSLIFYVVPAAYAYILFKALSFKKITTDVLFVFLGVTLTLLVTFINPARGWYLWMIPFLVYFFAKERISSWIYGAFSAAYLLYFLFVPESDVFGVFQLVAPGLSHSMTPYYQLAFAGFPADILVNVLFTALTATLLYMSYII